MKKSTEWLARTSYNLNSEDSKKFLDSMKNEDKKTRKRRLEMLKAARSFNS